MYFIRVSLATLDYFGKCFHFSHVCARVLPLNILSFSNYFGIVYFDEIIR
jgi:hypothetical protein